MITLSYYSDALLLYNSQLAASSTDSNYDLHCAMHCEPHLGEEEREDREEILSHQDHHFRPISTSRPLCRTDYTSD